jgi:heme A synthase
MLHRYFAVVVAGFTLFTSSRMLRLGDEWKDNRLVVFGSASAALVLLQIALGILSIKSYLGIPFVTAHLAIGTLLIASALSGYLYLRFLHNPYDDRLTSVREEILRREFMTGGARGEYERAG